MHAAQPRYQMLDAWRGLAALAVVLFHCSNTIVTAESLPGRLLLGGWTGVFVFFPISGYCILAALHGVENRTVGAFLARRWRRIVLPYWASIALAVAIALAALPFNNGSLDAVTLSARTWASVLTLTQVFTPHVGVINPVYWSLCYEEQFYLVMAVLLLVPSRRRPLVLAGITAAAALYVSPASPWRLAGFFLDYWLCFASGCAVYLWLHARDQRRWAVAIAGIITYAAVMTPSLVLVITGIVALALIALAPLDRWLAASRVGSSLIAFGTVSYSLYLVHVPVGGRLVNMLNRTPLPSWLVVTLAAASSIGAAVAFYVVVEKRARQARCQPWPDGRPVPAVVTA